MKQEAFSYNGIYCCNGQEEIQQMVVWAIRISSIGYIFMGLSIGVQGVLQALGYALKTTYNIFIKTCRFGLTFSMAILLIVKCVNAGLDSIPNS
ncbi:MAG: hypothetical protein MSH40_03475 [Christensenella sp.]|nr:hypothetical protein [Christensenella sp.]